MKGHWTRFFSRDLRLAAAASLTGAIALLALPSLLLAQAPATQDADEEYANGALPNDPAFENSLPVVPRYRAYLPPTADLSGRMPTPGSQGKLGSCTAWAAGYAARSYYTSTIEGRDIRRNANVPSPNFIYHLARPAGDCKGTNLKQVVDVLKQGALSLHEYPYSSECAPPPPPQVAEKAHDFRVRGIRRVDFRNLDDIKGNLTRSQPVIIAFADSKAFHAHRGVTGKEVFSELVPAEPNGYHAMVIVGYDDSRQAFRLINSWGTNWGDGGYAWLSYDLVKSRVVEAHSLDVAPPEVPVAERQNVALKPVAQPPVQPPPVTRVDPPPQIQVPPKVVTPPQPSVQPPVEVPVQVSRKADLSDLARLSCARVAVQKREERNVLVGFVGSEADLKLVNQIASNVPNTSASGVTLAPWPQCEALLTLEKPLNASEGPRLTVDATGEMHAGDTLKVAVRSPAQISYLYVAYIQADGSVVTLAQPKGVVPQPTLPNQSLVFGDGMEGRAKFTIGPPFGPEAIIAITSRSPLFDAEQPLVQTEREYLSALRRALIYKPDPALPDREVTATIKLLQTSAR